MIQTQAVPRAVPPKKIRRYVVVYQCPVCKCNGVLDDFEGEYDVKHCSKVFTVSLNAGILPDWVV